MQRYVSDELTHFVGRSLADDQARYNLFVDIVRTGWLRESNRDLLGPGFTGNSDGRKALSSNDAIRTTSVCFCDIPERTLGIHMKKYGSFGIALPKSFLVSLGATPVHYVAQDAKNIDVGIGPLTVGARLDKFRSELQQFEIDLGDYVEKCEGRPSFLTKLSPPGTPPGHKLMGQFSAIEGFLEFIVFGQLKFFNSKLSEDDPNNFYMEREWRTPAGVAFSVRQIVRAIMPLKYVDQFREEFPAFSGDILAAESLLVSTP